jgi:hypothetical protein
MQKQRGGKTLPLCAQRRAKRPPLLGLRCAQVCAPAGVRIRLRTAAHTGLRLLPDNAEWRVDVRPPRRQERAARLQVGSGKCPELARTAGRPQSRRSGHLRPSWLKSRSRCHRLSGTSRPVQLTTKATSARSGRGSRRAMAEAASKRPEGFLLRPPWSIFIGIGVVRRRWRGAGEGKGPRWAPG